MAKKDKQLEVLEHYWELFAAEYSLLEDGGSLRFQRPVFQKWRVPLPEDCNVLLIDESHDLDPDDQAAVAAWLNTEGAVRYLAIACDRHQKLRLVGANAVLVEGLNFSNQTKKLRRNYRNPFPVYAAGLALMFRWLATSGPKIIPTQTQLKDEFGFDVTSFGEAARSSITLKNWNDSHPGNYWSFTTSTFFSCEDAYAQLANAGLSRRDVLWVRFREEEEGFDYEKLLRFTYHNVHTDESFDIVDKYVKGQEFPVVIIEGFPSPANHTAFGEAMDDAEKEMWKARRQLYLCCSRSTAFLYFVLPNPEGGQFKGMSAEILELVKQVSTPELPAAATKRIWRLQFYRTGTSRGVDDFLWEGHTQQPAPVTSEVEIEGPVTVRKLAAALNLDAGALFTMLFAQNVVVKFSTDVLPDEIAREMALKNGIILRTKPLATEPPVVARERPTPPPRLETGGVPPIEPTKQLERKPELPTLPAGSELEAALESLIASSNYLRLHQAVQRYIAVLIKLIEKHPLGRDTLLQYRRGTRRYFATSAEEIERHATNPNPKHIGATGLHALTTTDNKTKREIADDLMRQCGVRLGTREKVISTML
jgi:hypothetical protein